MENRMTKDGAIARPTRTPREAIVLIVVAFATSPLAAASKYSDWSEPQNLGDTVNSSSAELAPAISKDGRSLYFASNRAGGLGDFDIWVSKRASEHSPWGQPVNLGPMVNTTALESVPSLSRDGHWLFFNSNRPGGFGGVDIWASYRFDKHDDFGDFGWQPPVNLGPEVNTAFLDQGAFLFENDDDDGGALLFFGSDRPGGAGALDIYVSQQMDDGSFGPASIVSELSTPQNDQRAVVRRDGLELFLFSDRTGTFGLADLWTSTRESVDQPWSTPVNLGSTVNSTSADAQPFLSSDRESLFFTSNRSGNYDLYVTTRSKRHECR
jgi:hypothetical protein